MNGKQNAYSAPPRVHSRGIDPYPSPLLENVTLAKLDFRRANSVTSQTAFVSEQSPETPRRIPPEGGREEQEFRPNPTLSTRPGTEAPIIKLETMGLTRQNRQERFDFDRSLVTQQIVAKLDSCGASDLADPLRECHVHWMVRKCDGCAKTTKFFNRCDKFFCPNCQPKLARLRAEGIHWWAANIRQPKHLVLTIRNFPVLTRRKIVRFQKAFVRLRRSVFATKTTTTNGITSYPWQGGCFSLEVTNEGRGWHLHLHALIDCRFVDSAELARRWAKLVGQDFGIVKVKDCRDGDYLREVTKYAVKGTDLATWPGEQIAEFIRAFARTRTFGTFGTLYKRREQFTAWLEQLKENRNACECGCEAYHLFSSDEWEWIQHTTGCAPPTPASAPIRRDVQNDLFNLDRPGVRD